MVDKYKRDKDQKYLLPSEQMYGNAMEKRYRDIMLASKHQQNIAMEKVYDTSISSNALRDKSMVEKVYDTSISSNALRNKSMMEKVYDTSILSNASQYKSMMEKVDTSILSNALQYKGTIERANKLSIVDNIKLCSIKTTYNQYGINKVLDDSTKSNIVTDLYNNIDQLKNNVDKSYEKGSIESLISIDRLTRLPDNFRVIINEGSEVPVLRDTESHSEMPLSTAQSTMSLLDVFENITEEEVVDFYHHISKYPMLGLQHKIGRKIFKVMPKVELYTMNNSIVYHCRPRSERDMPYSENELFEAPYGISSHGRYNLIGEGFLYTNNTLDGALAEVRYEVGKRTDAIKWELTSSIRVLDLSEIGCPLIDICNIPANNDGKIEMAYFIPNFLASCCRFHNIQGIRYKSFRYRGSINYVFFDYAKSWFKRISSSFHS